MTQRKIYQGDSEIITSQGEIKGQFVEIAVRFGQFVVPVAVRRESVGMSVAAAISSKRCLQAHMSRTAIITQTDDKAKALPTAPVSTRRKNSVTCIFILRFEVQTNRNLYVACVLFIWENLMLF